LTKLLPKLWWLPFLEHSVVVVVAAAAAAAAAANE